MDSVLEHYTTVISQDIIWGDMDAFQHVNNKVYFRYFEDVRIAYFDQLGMREYMAETNIGPILAGTECRYKLPLTFPDRIHIATRCELKSSKSFEMEYVVFSEQHQAIAAEGKGFVVYYDYNQGKSCDVPESIVSAMRSLAGN